MWEQVPLASAEGGPRDRNLSVVVGGNCRNGAKATINKEMCEAKTKMSDH